MSQILKVDVNKNFNFEVDTTTISKLDISNHSESEFHILQNHKSYHTEIIHADFNKKTYTVKVNNNTYTVDIHNALDNLIKKMGFEVGASKQVNEIKAPMPGLILDINVEVGQEVKENDPLLILEAMKMENVLASPRDGVIKSIAVAKTDAVEKNQLLIEFES